MLKYNVDLSKYSPLEIIELHQRGLITLQEIYKSRRAYDSFGNELIEYLREINQVEPTRMCRAEDYAAFETSVTNQ